MNPDFLYILVMFLCNVAETAFILLIHSALLHPRSGSWGRRILLICATSLTLFAVSTLCPLPRVVQLALCFGVFFFYACLFEGSWFRRLLSTAFAMCFLLSIEPLLLLLPFPFMPETGDLSYTAILFSESVTLLVGWLFCKLMPRRKSEHSLPPVQRVLALFYPFMAVCMSFLVTKLTQQESSPLLTGMSLLLFASLLAHMLLIEILNDQAGREQQLLLVRQAAALEQEKAEALLDAYTAQRKLSHEFSNHILALDTCVQAGDLAGAAAYIRQIRAENEEQLLVVNTRNPILDALFSRKYREASQAGISVFFDLCDLSAIPLETPELVVILANLLSNAIEGAAGATSPELRVKVRNNGDELFLSVRNRVKRDIPIRNNQPPATTKPEPGHGIGLQNVLQIVRKHNGLYAISCEKGYFQVAISIPKTAS